MRGSSLEPVVAIIILLTTVNVLGVRWGGLVQNVTTWLKVGTLLTIAVLPFVLGVADLGLLSTPGNAPETGRLVGFGAAVLGVLWLSVLRGKMLQCGTP